MARKRAKALPRPEPEMYTIYADILQETEAQDGHEGAILVNCDGDEVWLAISQIEFAGERGDTDVEITLPDWLAEEKGLTDGQGRTADVGGKQTTPISGESEGETVEAQSEDGEIKPDAKQPTTFTFKADVENVYDEKYVLLVTAGPDKTASLEFGKDEVSYEGKDVTELEEGYKGMEFTVSWELAAEKHLPEFLGAMAMPPAVSESAAQPAEVGTDEADERPQARPYHRKLREESITASVGLTHKELEDCTKRISRAWNRRSEYKEQSTYYSGLARNAEKEMNKAVDALNEGCEVRTVDCDVMGDFNTGEVIWVERDHPYREIQRRPMTDSDRQLTLPMDAAPAGGLIENAFPELSTAPPAEPETVTLSGSLLHADDDGIIFLVAYGDEQGTEIEFEISREHVVSLETKVLDDEVDQLTVTRAYAIEAGIIAAPEDSPAQVRDCQTCAHDGKADDDACESCTDELSGWYPKAEDSPAADAAGEPEAERSCGTCARIHETPKDGEESPCTDCGNGELPNYLPMPEQPQAAGAVQ